MVGCGRGGRLLDSAKQKCYPNRAKQGKFDRSNGGPMPADVGSKAPDFTLTSHERQPVTLSAQRGRPVVSARRISPRNTKTRKGAVQMNVFRDFVVSWLLVIIYV